MMRVLLMCMLLYVAPAAFGQVSIGVRGGYNASNIEISGNAPAGMGIGKGYMKPLHSWHADFMLNIPLIERLYLQPYIRYIRKGAVIRDQYLGKPDLSGMLITKGTRLELDYLELPLNLVYKLPVGNGRLVGGVGPYVGYGIRGKYSFTMERDGEEVSRDVRKVQFSGKADDNLAVIRMAPWEAGAHLSVGYEFFSSVNIAVNCNIGLTDTDRSELTRSRNQYVGLSVGFLFNREDY